MKFTLYQLLAYYDKKIDVKQMYIDMVTKKGQY